ncbi:hypothetical protein [Metabacillus arenae]|uniref:Uncharacterized protein n=1 Tax=Metabacillus arenae TaxID=2771434 RepID=A0A926N9H4_9BACI|nr:hypothetical protein [Metabacillus arenae]MBD1379214.1 hypothetical protein [Metabacillus arenae]
MDLKDFSIEVENILKDEELLRLLHNKPQNRLDDPLDESKPNILEKDDEELWELIDFHLIPAIKIDDLEENQICRIFYYAGNGAPTNTNYLFSNQEYIFDVLVHNDFQIMDKRLEMICDRLNDLIFNKRVGGIGKTLFKRRHPINAPKNYMAFRLIYEFCNENF